MNARADISTARAPDDCLVGLPLLDPAAARALILADVRRIEGEEVIPLGAVLGRVAAADIRSPVALPRFDNSAVDGFGLHLEDLQQQPPFSLSIVAKVAAGHGTGKVLRPGQAFRILTGARIPEGVSAVILEERTSRSAAEVTLHTVPEVGANIRGRGEDVALDTVVVPCGTILDARHLAILAASGASSAPVFRRLRIGVMSTGDELVEPAIDTTPNAIIDTNRPMLLSLLSSNAFDVVDLGIVPDDCDDIERTISRASLHLDLLLSSGGVAGSDADHLDPAIHAAGGRCMPFKLALRPGKPIAKGKVGDMHVLALPGNPVAALVNFLLFGRPLIRRMMGAIEAELRPQFSRTDGLFDHRSGRTEFVPVRIEGRGADGLPIVGKLGRGGSARLLPLVMCDGFAEIGPDVGDLENGAMVRYHPFSTAFGL